MGRGFCFCFSLPLPPHLCKPTLFWRLASACPPTFCSTILAVADPISFLGFCLPRRNDGPTSALILPFTPSIPIHISAPGASSTASAARHVRLWLPLLLLRTAVAPALVVTGACGGTARWIREKEAERERREERAVKPRRRPFWSWLSHAMIR